MAECHLGSDEWKSLFPPWTETFRHVLGRHLSLFKLITGSPRVYPLGSKFLRQPVSKKKRAAVCHTEIPPFFVGKPVVKQWNIARGKKLGFDFMTGDSWSAIDILQKSLQFVQEKQMIKGNFQNKYSFSEEKIYMKYSIHNIMLFNSNLIIVSLQDVLFRKWNWKKWCIFQEKQAFIW